MLKTNIAIGAYRGPQRDANGLLKPGGVAATMAQIMACEDLEGGRTLCLHLEDNKQLTSDTNGTSDIIAEIPDDIVQLHYRYCGNFIWPAAHGLWQHVVYDISERNAYTLFQTLVLKAILKHKLRTRAFFWNDFQFGLMPSLSRQVEQNSVFFHHIPWPTASTIPDACVEPLFKLATGMLGGSAIGFHRQSYADNFLDFIEQYMPEWTCDREQNTAYHVPTGHSTRLITAPIGVDAQKWRELSESGKTDQLACEITGHKTALCVARADYTKGIPDLIYAWVEFCNQHPRLAHDAQLYLIVTATRDGIETFASEWNRIEEAFNAIPDQWKRTVVWQQSAVSPDDLAALYRQCRVLMVPATIDGYNLTAAEFIASCDPARGQVLALSRGAGVFDTLGEFAIELHPDDIDKFANDIATCFMISKPFATSFIRRAQSAIPTISQWWQQFHNVLVGPGSNRDHHNVA